MKLTALYPIVLRALDYIERVLASTVVKTPSPCGSGGGTCDRATTFSPGRPGLNPGTD